MVSTKHDKNSMHMDVDSNMKSSRTHNAMCTIEVYLFKADQNFMLSKRIAIDHDGFNLKKMKKSGGMKKKEKKDQLYWTKSEIELQIFDESGMTLNKMYEWIWEKYQI